MLKAVGLFAMTMLLGVVGCGDDQDPEGARVLWGRIHDEGYQQWMRAPGHERRRASDAPHGGEVDIYVNEVVGEALGGGAEITSWPVGSLIVKDGFEDGAPHLVAAMEKRVGGWFWSEWSPDGEAVYSGAPELCTGCHAAGADFVRAFGFQSASAGR